MLEGSTEVLYGCEEWFSGAEEKLDERNKGIF
jgi:hypothetical protein